MKDLIRDGEVHFKYCPTEDMVADLFTKALQEDTTQHYRLRVPPFLFFFCLDCRDVQGSNICI